MTVARVYVVDPLPVARAGYTAILHAGSLHVVGSAGTLDRAESELAIVATDVVVLDTRLPRSTWTRSCTRIRAAAPRAAVLLVLETLDRRVTTEAHVLGVRGVIRRSATPEQIRQAVTAIAAGQTYFERSKGTTRRSEAGEARVRPFGLTVQQMRVLELLTRGLTNREIGAELGISEHTVKTHLTHVTRKLSARDRAHAAVIALREGLI